MDVLKFIVLLITSECLLGIFYYFITPKSIRKRQIIDYKSLLKGFVERMFLLISFIHDYPHALTLFGTLKLATRLKRDSEGDIVKESLYNDFYLFGNFISITVAILYSYLYHLIIH
ncbi:hypothetical protein SGQ44_05250 [Flavobacterium sp. Fl-77]|uniref:Uncharacterized protein n=1 Tax=Flavobacterium flavipigmentatum TaxID=2893884 RepID=A0AAJ2SDW3_9FLAO|nr:MULTISPECIES: hypothetical protein [unclassified Flavobacterium]MDX6181816.1 hypothetical protein [Flavobacterium sp. Fl-33]MDX6185150.1 hypothetical protein [Flavobacterium sp. Fl-77]UFH37257.1 hypothetical protein LNP22_10980 [Flavobacterium sp. F-70]